MPPKNNKKKQQLEKQMDRIEKQSKWASILAKQNDSDQEADAQQLYSKPTKQIFHFDFSNQRALYKQKTPPKKQQPKIILTPEQQAELDRRLKKQKQQKQAKNRIKRQKEKERKKIIEQSKRQQQLKRQQLDKQKEEVDSIIKKDEGKPSDMKCICLSFIVFFILLGALQYHGEIYLKLSQFRIDSSVNYYEVLQTESGVTDAQLKEKYKKLVTKYHPDKNTNCENCMQKFDAIMKAWQILGNPQKRKAYDENSGLINQILSTTLTLTPDNYQTLVVGSDSLWIIQVYDSTDKNCHYFANIWEEISQKNKLFANFGRIDVWRQSNMKSYLPYKFQIFPGFYTVNRGQVKLCQFYYQTPTQSIQSCITSQYSQNLFKKITNLTHIPVSNKKNVIFGNRVKIGAKIKIIHKKFENYFNYFIIEDNGVGVKVKESGQKFYFSQEKSSYEKYQQFLESHIVQKKSICEIKYICQKNPCIITLQKNLTLPHQRLYSVYEIKQQKVFIPKIEQIKIKTGLKQRFDIGLYENGRIELGYIDQIQNLNAQNGQLIELQCKRKSFWQKVLENVQYIKSFIQ